MNSVVAEKTYEDCLLRPGNTNCGGCGMSIGLTMLGRALGQQESVLVIPACCWSIIAGPYPQSSLNVPLFHTAFETGGAVASGIKAALEMRGLALEADSTGEIVGTSAGPSQAPPLDEERMRVPLGEVLEGQAAYARLELDQRLDRLLGGVVSHGYVRRVGRTGVRAARPSDRGELRDHAGLRRLELRRSGRLRARPAALRDRAAFVRTSCPGP